MSDKKTVKKNKIKNTESRAKFLYDKFIELKGHELIDQDKEYYKSILNKYFK